MQRGVGPTIARRRELENIAEAVSVVAIGGAVKIPRLVNGNAVLRPTISGSGKAVNQRIRPSTIVRGRQFEDCAPTARTAAAGGTVEAAGRVKDQPSIGIAPVAWSIETV